MGDIIYLIDAIKSLKPNAICTVKDGSKEDCIIVFHDDTVLTKDEIFAEQTRLQDIEDAK
tara:strand:- start:7 stop:186 length:180 start_codon:yes stop_codon:yes gene_type:complete